MHIVVRHDGGASALSASLRAAVAAVEPEAQVGRIRTMRDVEIDELAADRYVISVLGAFAVVALVLASVGVYGVASQAARLRTQEVGIRIAIGASAWSVGRTLVARGMTFIVVGITIGAAATFVTGRLLRSQLFRVEPTDPLTLATVAVLLLSVALVAIAIPARRAVKIDPVRVLRGEQV
jgi:ABC-type antimicrobial peptide transport system permease subunit